MQQRKQLWLAHFLGGNAHASNIWEMSFTKQNNELQTPACFLIMEGGRVKEKREAGKKDPMDKRGHKPNLEHS